MPEIVGTEFFMFTVYKPLFNYLNCMSHTFENLNSLYAAIITLKRNYVNKGQWLVGIYNWDMFLLVWNKFKGGIK